MLINATEFEIPSTKEDLEILSQTQRAWIGGS